MKKLVSLFLVFTFLTSILVPAVNAVQASDPAIPGKIAIITVDEDYDEEAYQSALEVVNKYGAENVPHVTWSMDSEYEFIDMDKTVSDIATDPAVKVLIINPAVPGTNAAVDSLLEKRDDLFIVYCEPYELPEETSKRANLIIQHNIFSMGYDVPVQAKKLGAEVFVHYSFERHMSNPLTSNRLELMRAKCEEIGIMLVEATCLDPMSDGGAEAAIAFLLEDVPKMVEKYGKDTAFFSTNCYQQLALIPAVIETGAIYPAPCEPSPYHGFTDALDLGSGFSYIEKDDQVIAKTTKILEENGMIGRVSTWPVSQNMLTTNAVAEYGVRWMKGEVPATGLDLNVLKSIMTDYAGTGVDLGQFVDNGINNWLWTENPTNKIYDNFFVTSQNFLTYGSELPSKSVPASNRPTTVSLGDKSLEFSLPIIEKNDRTFYPMRELFEAFGATVTWDEESLTATGQLDDNKADFIIDSNTFYVNGVEQQMDAGVTAFINADRTYIPIRFAAEALGFAVEWVEATDIIKIK